MHKDKDFGIISGIFLPYIIGVASVVLFLRFPLLVGQNQLFSIIGVVLLAFFMAFTAGHGAISITSKNSQQKGNSNSALIENLGFSVGGGLSYLIIFVLASGISLFVTGFAESFVRYFNFEFSANSLRITGFSMLFVVFLFRKSALGLSNKLRNLVLLLLSLAIGSILFGNFDYHTEAFSAKPTAGIEHFISVLGVFLPAVLGFERIFAWQQSNAKNRATVNSAYFCRLRLSCLFGFYAFFYFGSQFRTYFFRPASVAKCGCGAGVATYRVMECNYLASA